MMWLSIQFILVVGVLVRTSYQQMGVQIAPCIWQWNNGTVINLYGVGYDNGTARWHNKPSINPDVDMNTYSVNPCYGFTFSANCEDVTACRTSNLGHQLNIGEASPSNMFYSSDHNTVVLEYQHAVNGTERTVSRILTGCITDTDDQLIVYGVTESTRDLILHEFFLLSQCACPDVCANHTAHTVGIPTTGEVTHVPIKTVTPPATVSQHPIHPGSKRITPGGIICIIFVVSVCAYFLFGSAYMYCFRGATGIEIIPNVHFWMGLPNLIFDGMIFICNCGAKTRVVTTSPPTSEYDKI